MFDFDSCERELDYKSLIDEANIGGGPEVKASSTVPLSSCIRQYCEREQLDQTETWYCDKCKTHNRAFKQIRLYKAPKNLIIHLKRFKFSDKGRREKLETYVDFELEGMDIGEYERRAKRAI